MRFWRHLSGLAGLLALALLTGCGSQGNPLPPSLELPKPVSDLKAVRKGDKVLLTWTAPRETTDKLHIKEAGKTRVCRSTAAPAAMECTEVASLPAAPAPGAAVVSHTDTLPHALQEQSRAGFAVYTVEVVNPRGRTAGLSNAVKVPLAPTLPPPSDLKAEVTADAVVLSFTPVAPPASSQGDIRPPPDARAPLALFTVYRIYRRAKGAVSETLIGEVPISFAGPLKFADKGFQWEASYDYRVAGVTNVTSGGMHAEVEGEDSTIAEILTHDSFPPAAPTAVEAVAVTGITKSGTPNVDVHVAFIDLTWTPNNEADLAGYNVYRREAGGQPQKINGELIKTPAFGDANVTAGHTYLYTVSAVDLRANESGRSEETSETVPQP